MRHEFTKYRVDKQEVKVLQSCIHCGSERWLYANGCRTYLTTNGKLTTTATLCYPKQPEIPKILEIPEVFKKGANGTPVEVMACLILMYEELTDRGIRFKGETMAKSIITAIYNPVKPDQPNIE